MLVLSRKIGESIVIGDNISLTILESQNGEVKLGITAPKEITILRKEIFDEIEEQNIASSKIGPKSINDLVKQIKSDHKKK